MTSLRAAVFNHQTFGMRLMTDYYATLLFGIAIIALVAWRTK